jgi:sugar phosphate isomerase/epimerase
MEDPLAAYGLVGIVHPMAFPEVAGGEGPMKDRKVRAQAAHLLATAGMEVIFSAQGPLMQQGLSLCDPNQAGRQKAVDACRGMMDEAYQMGAAIFVVVSGRDPGEGARGAATKGLIDSVKQLCADAQEKAGERMLAISLENCDREVDKKCLLGPTREAAQVAQAIRGEYSNFGLTIDLSHQPLLRESVDEMVLAAVDHLIHVHVGNCVVGDSSDPAYGDRSPRFGLPGSAIGVEELKRFLEALIYGGYFRRNTPTTMPVVSFEVRPLENENSDLVIANAKRALAQAWARM